MKYIISFLLLCALVFFSVFYVTLLTPNDTEGAAVIFEVAPGESGRAIVRRLKEQGLIKSELPLLIYSRLTGMTSSIRVGEYEVSPAMSAIQIKNVLVSGKSIERSITFQEGLNIFEIAEMYENAKFGSKQEFIKRAFDKTLVKQLLGEDLPSLEGYLFPDTYKIDKYSGPKKLIEEMVRNYLKNYAEIEAEVNGKFSRHQLTIFASMIEKETGAPEERPIISSVFHNRLKKKMRLQSDPTIIYGIAYNTGVMPKNISRKDITTPTAFNTYTVNGLPFGPIANPGKESMLAVIKPATTEYLYFVSKNDGTHVFTTNYKDHNNAVTEWQRTRANREGKSWRDRTKQK